MQKKKKKKKKRVKPRCTYTQNYSTQSMYIHISAREKKKQGGRRGMGPGGGKRASRQEARVCFYPGQDGRMAPVTA